MKRIAPFVVALLALAVGAAADEAASMHAAADGFYGVYRQSHAAGGIPDDALLAKYRPYLSAGLEALLRQAQSSEARFAATNKASPPLVEGDVFSSLFEGATQVVVADCSGDAAKGQCRADLVYTAARDKPVHWSDVVYLVKTPQGWRVDDIGYGGGWDFANKGRLSETLRQAISFQ